MTRRGLAGTAVAGGALLSLLAIASILLGAGTVDWATPDGRALIMTSRVPRTLAAMLCGTALAIAGLVMQALARNRFVEPSTAGTAQGAALGILAVTLADPGASLLVKTLCASVVALAATSIFLVVARRLPPTQPFLVALVGLIYGGVLGSAVTYLAWRNDLLQYLDIWLNGEYSGVMRGRYEVLWVTAACVVAAWWVADQLTIMSLGRESAISLGINYGRILQFGLVVVSVVSAVTVAVVGTIPFVGLVVPAMVSRIAGDNLRVSIPACGLLGALLVLACDVVGRAIRYPYEIPVGTVLGVVGACLFLWLLRSARRHA